MFSSTTVTTLRALARSRPLVPPGPPQPAIASAATLTTIATRGLIPARLLSGGEGLRGERGAPLAGDRQLVARRLGLAGVLALPARHPAAQSRERDRARDRRRPARE